MSTTVRVTEETRTALRELAQETGQSMQALLEAAIEAYRREVFFARLDDAFSVLRADPEAWDEVLEERRVLDGALTDGLDD